MIDTIKIRRLLLKALKNPKPKTLAELEPLVFDLCDAYDKQPNVMDVINKNQESLDHTFSFIKDLGERVHG